MLDVEAVQRLLALGADPDAGPEGTLAAVPVVGVAAPGWGQAAAAAAALDPAASRITGLLLQAGADSLRAPGGQAGGTSLLARYAAASSSYHQQAADVFLAHLEQQRVAGALQLSGHERATQLLLGAALRGHGPLLDHALAHLERTLGGRPLGYHASHALSGTLFALARSSRAADALPRLLGSTIAWDTAARDSTNRTLLAVTAASPAAPAAVPLLHRAGALLTADALLEHVEQLAPAAVQALLACGRPASDTSKPDLLVHGRHGFSCAIHRALNAANQLLQVQVQCFSWWRWRWAVGSERWIVGPACSALALMLCPIPPPCCTGPAAQQSRPGGGPQDRGTGHACRGGAAGCGLPPHRLPGRERQAAGRAGPAARAQPPGPIRCS